jgi:aarF domain-containing kinase
MALRATFKRAFDNVVRGSGPTELHAIRHYHPSYTRSSAAVTSSVVASAGGYLLAKRLAQIMTATAVTAGGAYTYNEPGMQRSLQFWLGAFPVFCHYKLTEYLVSQKTDEEQSEAFEALHNRYAPTVEALTLKLRGFYLKSAQFVAIMDDFLPPQYMKFAKRTQDQVPTSMTSEQVRSIVESSLGQPIEEVFAMWENEPMGAASIGQVHRGRLKDGREVVVKVMYPGVERLFRWDLKSLKDFAWLAQPMHLPYLNEIEKQFLTEFDYLKEAHNLEKVRQNIMPTWGRQVAVPQPVLELCSTHVLVMTHLSGKKLTDGVRDHYRKIAAQMGRSLEELAAEQKARTLRGDGPVKRSVATLNLITRLQTYALTVGDLIRNVPRAGYNYTLGLALGKVGYVRREKPINLGEILELLMKVHAHEIFTDGIFNGDPHPGNILLMDDGRLGLIDYGQVCNIITSNITSDMKSHRIQCHIYYHI